MSVRPSIKSHNSYEAIPYITGMKVTQKATLRNGVPCSAISIDETTIERVAAAYRAGVMVTLTYANLQGVAQTRACVVEAMYLHLDYLVIKGRDFGHRTVFFERILGVK